MSLRPFWARDPVSKTKWMTDVLLTEWINEWMRISFLSMSKIWGKRSGKRHFFPHQGPTLSICNFFPLCEISSSHPHGLKGKGNSRITSIGAELISIIPPWMMGLIGRKTTKGTFGWSKSQTSLYPLSSASLWWKNESLATQWEATKISKRNLNLLPRCTL